MSDPTTTSPGQNTGQTGLFARLRAQLRQLLRLRSGEGSLRTSVEEAIEEHEERVEPISGDERSMLLNVLSLRDIDVEDIMVPRADIVGLDSQTPFEALLKRFREANHTRMPVYRDSLDDVVGMVHIKDVLAALADKKGGKPDIKLSQLTRPILFVPPSMAVLDVLRKMRAVHIHMALVVDEYGGTDGLVTIEDLVEEIVGEIEDEHDIVDEPQIISVNDNQYRADARAPLAELEERIGVPLGEVVDEDIDTLGGLVAGLAGRVPDRGEVIDHPAGVEFEVMEADPRRIKGIKITVNPPEPDEEEKKKE